MRCALFAVVAAAAGCSSSFGKSSPPPAPPVQTASSTFDIGNGVTLRVQREASGACTTAAVANGKELWSEHTCLGTKEHPWFVSADKEWLLVVERAPAIEGGVPSAVQVARLFRRGVLDRALTLADLSVAETAVQIEDGRLRWLGEDPKAAEDGLELRLADWTLARFRWPTVGAAPRKAAPSAARARACQPCSYVDEQGVYHLAATEEDIPAEYRTRARAIQAQVTTYAAPPRPVGRPAEQSGPQPWEIVRDDALRKKSAEKQRERAEREAVAARQFAEQRERDQNKNWMQRLADSPSGGGGTIAPRCYDNSMRPRPCDDGEMRQAAQNTVNAQVRTYGGQ